MAISDLTGTKWKINSTTCTAGYGVFSAQLLINGVLLQGIDTEFNIGYDNTGNYAQNSLSYYRYYDDDIYTSISVNDTITFIGGSDLTDNDLISWLEANATQIIEPTITDLTGYTWVGNATIQYDGNFPTYNINYKAYYNSGADYNNGTSLYMARQEMNIEVLPGEPLPIFYGLLGNGLINFSGVFFSQCIYQGNNTTTMSPATNQATLEYIEFTGGTDATDASPNFASLLTWLQNNGTLTPPATPSGKTKLGTLNIAKKMFGTLPIVKEVVDGMVVYEKESGPSGYSVSGHAGDIVMIGNEAYQYSIDDGTTWNNFTFLEANLFAPITTTQIKFRVKKLSGMEKSTISSTTLNCNITSNSSTYVYSSNYILGQNINDVVLGGRY